MIVACPRCQTTYDLDIPDDGRVSTVVCEADKSSCTYQFDARARPAMVAEATGRITEKQPDNGYMPTMKLHKYVDDLPVVEVPKPTVQASEPVEFIFNLSEEDKARLDAIYTKITELGLLGRVLQSTIDWIRHIRGADTPPEV